MGVAQIENPLGAYGQEATPHAVDIPIKLLGTVTKNDLVELVWSETTRLLTAVRMDTDSDVTSLCGVAQESGVSGEVIMVRIGGLAFVNIGTGSVAANELMIATANAGEADGVAADATTIAGTSFGKFLGDEDVATNTAPVWLWTA